MGGGHQAACPSCSPRRITRTGRGLHWPNGIDPAHPFWDNGGAAGGATKRINVESLRLRDARARGSFAACLAAVVACSLGGAALGDGLLCKGRDVLGSLALPGSARGVAVAGGTAYIANDFFGLRIIDVSNPASPVLLGTLDTPGQALRVTVVGTTAYVADYTAGLQIIDVSNPASPALIGSFDTAGEAEEVRVADGLAYIADGTAGLQIVDVSDPAAPKPVGSYPGIFCRGVRVVGDVTYVGTWTGDLGVIDTSDPAAPTLITNVATPGGFVDGLDSSS